MDIMKLEEAFENIEKAKENEGYLEWVDLVRNELSNVSNLHNLKNMKKRIELRLDATQKNLNKPDSLHVLCSCIAVLIPIVTSLLVLKNDMTSKSYELLFDTYQKIGEITQGAVVSESIKEGMVNYVSSFEKYSNICCWLILKSQFYNKLLELIEQEIKKRIKI